jgi:hypothetical protein
VRHIQVDLESLVQDQNGNWVLRVIDGATGRIPAKTLNESVIKNAAGSFHAITNQEQIGLLNNLKDTIRQLSLPLTPREFSRQVANAGLQLNILEMSILSHRVAISPTLQKMIGHTPASETTPTPDPIPFKAKEAPDASSPNPGGVQKGG